MSWSLVRTCRRCRTRAERPIFDGFDLLQAISVLKHFFENPDADQGCPSCDPKLAGDARIDLDEWGAAVARARGNPPS